MGAEGRYAWESPRHHVFVKQFELSTTAVIRREYALFLQQTAHTEPKGWAEPHFGDPEQPVVGVSWSDAVSYCDWFSTISGNRYRLPTEAEWEKACRGGRVDAKYAWGDEEPESFAYFNNEWTGPRRAGEWQANGFGLFNMGENVHEWCLDWYSPDYYAISPKRNPSGPQSGTRRVSRGGSWRHSVKASRAAHRSSLPPEYRYTDYGFRMVCEAAFPA
jgi:formylglycine-generating enzyme